MSNLRNIATLADARPTERTLPKHQRIQLIAFVAGIAIAAAGLIYLDAHTWLCTSTCTANAPRLA